MTRYCFSSVKLLLVRESSPLASLPAINAPTDAVHALREYIENEDREHFIILLLDTKHRAIGLHTVSIGHLNAALVHPREVFKTAMMGNAAALILAHNHPSGECIPSSDDVTLTRRLVDGGKLLGIDVLDHIVIGDGCYRSMQQERDVEF